MCVSGKGGGGGVDGAGGREGEKGFSFNLKTFTMIYFCYVHLQLYSPTAKGLKVTSLE